MSKAAQLSVSLRWSILTLSVLIAAHPQLHSVASQLPMVEVNSDKNCCPFYAPKLIASTLRAATPGSSCWSWSCPYSYGLGQNWLPGAGRLGFAGGGYLRLHLWRAGDRIKVETPRHVWYACYMGEESTACFFIWLARKTNSEHPPNMKVKQKGFFKLCL